MVLAAACLMLSLGTGVANYHQYARFLTIEDVQKITGLKDVTQAPQQPSAKEEMIFLSKDGDPVLTASFLPASAYVGARSSKAGVKSMVQGIGEEAFVGPASGPPLYILVFRKGPYTVVIDTELTGKTPVIPIEQLTAIAKLIASRIQ